MLGSYRYIYQPLIMTTPCSLTIFEHEANPVRVEGSVANNYHTDIMREPEGECRQGLIKQIYESIRNSNQ